MSQSEQKHTQKKLILGLTVFGVLAAIGTGVHLFKQGSPTRGDLPESQASHEPEVQVLGSVKGAHPQTSDRVPASVPPSDQGALAPSTPGSTPDAKTSAKAGGEESKPVALSEIEKIRKEGSGCVQVTFKLDKSEEREAARHTRNLIKLQDQNLNPKSVCVRVDGNPVKHKFQEGKKNELLIGNLSKPSSIVSVRYCLGKATCEETCVVPRDEFMEALAGEEELNEDSDTVAGWDASKEDQEVEKELQVFKAHLHRDPAGKPKITSGWAPEREVQACSRKS